MSEQTAQQTVATWLAVRPEGHHAQYSIYEPNGGTPMWTPFAWTGPDFFGELLGEDWETATREGNEIELFRHRGAVLRHTSLRWKADPSKGRHRVAYLGAHAGFMWEDESIASPALRVLLDYFRWNESELTKFGLACCDDYDSGDDGGYWLVADADQFAEVVAKCRAYSESEEWDTEDDDGELIVGWVLRGESPLIGEETPSTGTD